MGNRKFESFPPDFYFDGRKSRQTLSPILQTSDKNSFACKIHRICRSKFVNNSAKHRNQLRHSVKSSLLCVNSSPQSVNSSLLCVNSCLQCVNSCLQCVKPSLQNVKSFPQLVKSSLQLVKSCVQCLNLIRHLSFIINQ